VYEADVIRINSQSGKGGIGYLLETQFGLDLPKKMREEFGYIVKGISDHAHKELLPNEVHEIFHSTYVNLKTPLEFKEVHYVQKNGIQATVTLMQNGQEFTIKSDGDGRLDAVTNALKAFLGKQFTLKTYTEHALTVSSKSDAVSYVGIEADGKVFWGVGIRKDISDSSAAALFSALNRFLTNK
jgi:2-isopropylmalate synthase